MDGNGVHVEVIQSDAFVDNIPPRQDTMHSMYTDSIAEIPDLLVRQGYMDQDDTSMWVSTVVRTDDDGAPNEIFLSVYKKQRLVKFKAKKLFSQAPDDAMIRLPDLNYHAFNFPPSSNCSEWVSSKDLQMSVMKGSTMNLGVYTDEELPGIKIGEACFRLVVTPSEDINEAQVTMVALPVSMGEKSSLPGSPTGLSPGYPVIEVRRTAASMAGIQSPIRNDGLPFLPVLTSNNSPHPVPDVGNVKKAMYSFWGAMLEANLMSASMWHEETEGTAGPSTDQARTAYTWPELCAQNGESDSEIESEEDESTEAQRHLRIQARRIAADLAKSRGQSNGGSGDGQSNVGSGDDSSKKKTPSRKSTKKQNGKDKTNKRGRRSKTTSVADSGSDSGSASPVKKKAKPSHILNKEDWPKGYSKSQIDAMGVKAALALAESQKTKIKKQNEGLPGIKVSSTEVKIATITVKSGKDNADDILHPQRFELRPPVSPPAKWWPLIRESWPERKKQFASRYLGSGSSIPMKTFLAANDRSYALRAKHFLERNYAVDSRSKKGKAQLKDDGSLEYEGFDENYFDPESVHDMLVAIANLQAVYYQLWPHDYTPQVILRVATKYKFFVNGKCKQVLIFAKFFDKVLELNAEEPSKPPLDYEQAVLVAIEVMEKNDCPPVVPIVNTYYDTVQNFQANNVNNNNGNSVGRGGGPNTRGGRGRGGQGGGRGGRVDNSSRNTCTVGKMPGDLKLLRVGTLQICHKYNTTEGCKNPVDAKANTCTFGNVTRAHLCAIVVNMGNYGTPRFCGNQSHNAQNCPQRK